MPGLLHYINFCMTGVGGRPELIIEGSNNLDRGWKEYDFLYKPGNISDKLPMVAPHQPRLDWQMWFAALGSYQHNPWFIHLIYKLLHGEKDILKLLKSNPFPGKPPKYVRSKLYTYHYTRISKQADGIFDGIMHSKRIKNWWRRESPKEYTPPLSKDEPSLKKYINDLGWDVNHIKEAPKSFLQLRLLELRELVDKIDPTSFMLQILFLSTLTCILRSIYWMV